MNYFWDAMLAFLVVGLGYAVVWAIYTYAWVRRKLK